MSVLYMMVQEPTALNCVLPKDFNRFGVSEDVQYHTKAYSVLSMYPKLIDRYPRATVV